MKLAAVIFVFLTTSSSLFAQVRVFLGDTVTFLCVMEKTDTSGIDFKIDAFDTLTNRIDSIFKSPFREYLFTSYNNDGKLVGKGLFYFQGNYGRVNYTDKFLLKSSFWPDVTVWYLAKCVEQPNCDNFELQFTYNDSTEFYEDIPHGLLLGGQTGWTFFGKEIRRMPGRQ